MYDEKAAAGANNDQAGLDADSLKQLKTEQASLGAKPCPQRLPRALRKSHRRNVDVKLLINRTRPALE
jgi:hypothetical protein